MPPIITDPFFYAVAIPAVIFLGLSKGGFAGIGIASTPLLALYLPPLEAAALILPLLISQDIISIAVYRRHWDASNLKILLPGAVIGMALAWLVASHISDNAVRITIGLIGVMFVANVWLKRANTLPTRMGTAAGVFWGALSGFTSFMTQAGGPPYQVYVLPQRLPKLVLVGTTTIFFAVVNALKIVPYFALGQFTASNLATSVLLLPVAIVSNFAGIWLVRHMPTGLFYRIAYVLLFVISLALLWQGVTELWRK
ncbi:sulfite exporter TauE/SafE family protein [Tardiphaga sp.]|uniref:sulfite exporter TauE/SafE family protein n=1 Tax=Tardiphaga sp. TaxID=1926292 RepID=UPI002615C87E|nr:sulfite exporter TauE/SafE family protein [Tardiphaga sp.]